jgi:flagellar FliJ protein
MLAWDLYIRRLDQTAEKLAKDAALAEIEVNEKRDAYIEASRDRKVLDKLKEKKLKEYRTGVFDEESKELDDIRISKKA